MILISIIPKFSDAMPARIVLLLRNNVLPRTGHYCLWGFFFDGSHTLCLIACSREWQRPQNCFKCQLPRLAFSPRRDQFVRITAYKTSYKPIAVVIGRVRYTPVGNMTSRRTASAYKYLTIFVRVLTDALDMQRPRLPYIGLLLHPGGFASLRRTALGLHSC